MVQQRQQQGGQSMTTDRSEVHGKGSKRQAKKKGPSQQDSNAHGSTEAAGAAVSEDHRLSSQKLKQPQTQEAKSVAAASSAVPVVDAENDDAEVCFICAEPVKYYAMGICNHPICHICSLRLRALYKQRDCPMCKTELDQVVFRGHADHRQFEDYKLHQLKSDKPLSIYFEKGHMFDETMALLRYNCPASGCGMSCFTGWVELKKHIKNTHDLLMCELCTCYKKSFVHEHALFTSKALLQHNREGDPDDPSFKGHPECGFCKQRYYGADELYEHCRKSHEQCFLCTRLDQRHQYYVNYTSLEDHFSNDHFPCRHPSCLERKFVVFSSDIDLAGHELEVHADDKTKSRGAPLVLNFDYGGPSSSSTSFTDHSNHRKSGRGRGGRQQSETANGNRGQSSNAPESRDTEATHRRLQVPFGFGSQLSTPPPTATRASVDDFPPIQGESSESKSLRVPSSTLQLGAARTAFGVPASRTLPPTHAPTPAEAAALHGRSDELPLSQQQQQQQRQILERDLQLSQEPEIVTGLLKLFGFSSNSVAEFKRLSLDFRSGRSSASGFIDGYMNLALAGRRGKLLVEAQKDAGQIWMRLLETYGDSANGDGLDDGFVSAANQRGKGKKKKAVSLAEYEATSRTMPKKQAMLRAWNDYRIKIKHEQNIHVSAPVCSWESSLSGVGSSSGRGSSAAPTRVLVITPTGSKPRQVVGMTPAASSQKVALTTIATTRCIATDATVRLGSAVSPNTSPSMTRQSSTTSLSESQHRSQSPSQSQVQVRSDNASSATSFSKGQSAVASIPHRTNNQVDFPSLPTPNRPERMTLAKFRSNSLQQQEERRQATTTLSWHSEASGTGNYAASGSNGSDDGGKGKKKGKANKKGTVLFHSGFKPTG
ncbi:hypothetical protein BASA61_003417 [Batrachochytrium salamandrivorans]|nr:hypothetical protein BASA61_003417 [Batrachochytrium salamandrivorans]